VQISEAGGRVNSYHATAGPSRDGVMRVQSCYLVFTYPKLPTFDKKASLVPFKVVPSVARSLEVAVPTM